MRKTDKLKSSDPYIQNIIMKAILLHFNFLKKTKIQPISQRIEHLLSN